MKMTLFEGKLGWVMRKLRNQYKKKEAVPPKGCFPVDIVGEDEQEMIRYVISVEFLNSVWFKKLLDEYEEEIRMHGKGPITLPCSIHKFEEALSLANGSRSRREEGSGIKN
ncbi:hypothetical protein Pfo_007285 [Paulownia fortunei]|nr:hypothetical protein Pfo_007285 [Paulownia fortunei]